MLLSTLAAGFAAGAPPYSAVEVDPFALANGVTVPANYQTALADSVARELSVEFSTLIILHPAETAPDGRAVLRISGTVLQFRPPGGAKRLFSFGAGESAVTAVRFADAETGHVLAIREFQSSAATIGRRIAHVCRDEHFLDNN